MNVLEKAILAVVVFSLAAGDAFAIPPPDFIFNVGAQIAQVFSLAVIFGGALLAGTGRILRAYVAQMRLKKAVFAYAAALVLVVAGASAYAYGKYEQQNEYQKWVQEGISEESKSIKTYVQEVTASGGSSGVTATGTLSDHRFFDEHSELPLMVTNADMHDLLRDGAYVLDAREDEENAIGKFPGSTHIRFADLVASQWQEIPRDRVVYVLCWSGIRGKEVAQFLRTKNIVSRYLEKGASGWVEFGGKWEGEIAFSKKYPEKRYAKLIETDEVMDMEKKGTILIDSRNRDKYAAWHIPKSVNIPVIYTPSTALEEVFATLPPSRPVVTVCDDFVSCFDAKIAGIKLEKQGHPFLGRYNRIGEYRNAK